jgi:LysR family transcriptional activator of nhaA
MNWLNYHHLYYFWIVAKEETVTKATQVLKLSQPTISAQIKMLEESLDQKLFERVGRKLLLTDQGRVVFRYADDIFSTGQEMLKTLKGQTVNRPLKFNVGISDLIPKLIVYRLLQPVFDEIKNLEIHCEESNTEELLYRLNHHQLDLVISSSESSYFAGSKFYDHKLGSSHISFYGGKKLIKKYGSKFPDCLDEAPILMPSKYSRSRKEVEVWIKKNKISPRIVGEFDDSALMKVFGEFDNGYFFSPSVLKDDIEYQYKVKHIGCLNQVKESYYAISAERKMTHPAVVIINSQAKKLLF